MRATLINGNAWDHSRLIPKFLRLTPAEQSEEDADRLYEAGCDDGSICTSEGVTRIDFHREAESLEAAIRSAIADVRRAGFQVARFETDSPEYCSP